MQYHLTLPNDVNTITQLAAFVEGICEETGVSMETTMQLNLALEEAVVNVMNYAYPAGTIGYVDIDIDTGEQQMCIIISDSGIPFDPTTQKEVDITLSAEQRSIGGLGIHLIRQLMDGVSYERKDGRNILTLKKRINH